MICRTHAERGSALLIVFLLAAMIAIMLYKELPVAAFEARRSREQLLIDRGNEYAHAVKLFVRKMGTYPSSIDQLQSTNQMRFLRHRYKDPMTGKDDWRLLHAGPGGQLIDSKVNRNGNTATPNGTTQSANNSSSTSWNSSTSSSTTSSTGWGGFNSTSNSTPEATILAIPQRPPAIPANGAPSTGIRAADQNPMMPLLPTDATANANQNGTLPGGNAATGTTAAQAPANVMPGAAPMDTVRNLLNNPTSPPGPSAAPGVGSSFGSTASSSQMGTISSGGIAGVASKAEGHTIKTVNDQSDYSLWEFYYDPTKDATQGISNAMGGTGNMSPTTGLPTRPSVTPLGNSSSSFGFGSTNSSAPTNPTSTNPPQSTNSTSTNPTSTYPPQSNPPQ